MFNSLEDMLGIDIQKMSYLNKLIDFVKEKSKTDDINRIIYIISKRINIDCMRSQGFKEKSSWEYYDYIYNILYIQEYHLSLINDKFIVVQVALTGIPYISLMLKDFVRHLKIIDDICSPISIQRISFNVGYLNGIIDTIIKYINNDNKIEVKESTINDLLYLKDMINMYFDDRIELISKSYKEIASIKKTCENNNKE